MEDSLGTVQSRLTSQDDSTIPTGERRPEGSGLDSEYGTLLYFLNSGGGYGAGGAEGRPTAGAMERKRDLDATWSELKATLQATLQARVAAFNEEVKKLGLEGIIVTPGR